MTNYSNSFYFIKTRDIDTRSKIMNAFDTDTNTSNKQSLTCTLAMLGSVLPDHQFSTLNDPSEKM